MKLPLDTHIWLWSVLEPTRLSKRIARAIDNRENQLWLSPISVWKLLMLTHKGRVQLKEDAVSMGAANCGPTTIARGAADLRSRPGNIDAEPRPQRSFGPFHRGFGQSL
jgi:hypothetical protein